MTAPIVLHVGEFSLEAESREDEPRILDVDIATAAGLKRPRDVRALIRDCRDRGYFTDQDLRGNFSRKSVRGKSGSIRVVDVLEYRLTRKGTFKLLARINTPTAYAFVDRMVDVFDEAIRQLRAAPVAATIDLSIATGARMGDSPEGRERVQSACLMAARAQGVSIHAIHGYVRRVFKVPSAYSVPIVVWSHAREMIVAIAEGKLPIRKPRLALMNIRQMPLPGVADWLRARRP